MLVGLKMGNNSFKINKLPESDYGIDTLVDNKTNEIGLLIYTWDNTFADRDVPFACCVDKNGKKYNIEMDFITPIE